MTITRFSDYSLRIMMFAALRQGMPFSIKEVSASFRLSPNHVAKVIQFLVQRGYLKARRGRGGGVWLEKDPREIRIGTLVREAEQGAPLVECFNSAGNQCLISPACRLKGVLARAVEEFYKSLDTNSLWQIIENRDALSALIGPLPARPGFTPSKTSGHPERSPLLPR